jgi:hypothetical protein
MWAPIIFEESNALTRRAESRSHKARRTLMEEAVNYSDGALAPL